MYIYICVHVYIYIYIYIYMYTHIYLLQYLILHITLLSWDVYTYYVGDPQRVGVKSSQRRESHTYRWPRYPLPPSQWWINAASDALDKSRARITGRGGWSEPSEPCEGSGGRRWGGANPLYREIPCKGKACGPSDDPRGAAGAGAAGLSAETFPASYEA